MAGETTVRPTRTGPGDGGLLRRDLGRIGLLFSAIGSIIGSGWLFGAFNAAKLAGPAAVFSWLIGAIIIVLIGLSYAELGTMFPHAGGVARYPHYSFGSFASYTTGWVTWLAAAAVAPAEVIAALQYATGYLQHINVYLAYSVGGTPTLTGAGYGVAAGLLLVFSFVNLIGIRWFARLNNLVVWWKLAIIIAVIVALLALALHGSQFGSHGFAPFGTTAIFTSLPAAGIVFSYLGFRQGIELAGETKNPRRNVPLTLIGSVVVCAVLYILLQVAFIGALPGRELDSGWANILSGGAGTYGPLASIVGLVGLSWLAYLLYADAFVSPADTGLIYLTVTTRLSYAMGRNNNAPTGLSRVNAAGVPWISVILSFVAGLIFMLPFPSWSAIVSFITSATVLSFGSGPVVLLAMRRQLPNRERPFRLPGGPVIPFLGFWGANLIIYWAGWDTNSKLFVAVLVGFVLLGINEFVSRGKTARFRFANGWWILPWFGGLCLLSYLGGYPSSGAGNLDVVPYAWAVLAVFSALVMWLALRLRLSDSETGEQVPEASPDAAAGPSRDRGGSGHQAG